MYRKRLDEVNGPCIPLIDLCIKDLQQWRNNLNPLFKETKLINFERESMLGTFSFVVEKLLKPKYTFKELSNWQSYLSFSIWNYMSEKEMEEICNQYNDDPVRAEIINELKQMDKSKTLNKRGFLGLTLKRSPSQEPQKKKETETLRNRNSVVSSPPGKKKDKSEDQLIGDDVTPEKKGTRPPSRSILTRIKRVASTEFIRKPADLKIPTNSSDDAKLSNSTDEFPVTEEHNNQVRKSESVDELAAKIKELELKLQRETEARMEAERKISSLNPTSET